MASSTTTKLDLATRAPSHSREIRRLRRTGRVPGILYGRGQEPVAFDVGERDLRHALAGTGAVLEISVDGGGSAESAVVKETQRHPVRGDLMHVDLLRVDLNVVIQSTVVVHLVGGEDAPGVREGGVLSAPTSELTIEAKPNDIPDGIEVDVSALEVAGTLTLAEIEAPAGVTFLDDPEATIVATVLAPTIEEESDDDVETETEVIGEAKDGDAAAAAPAPEDGD